MKSRFRSTGQFMHMLILILLLAGSGCSLNQEPQVIVITATFEAQPLSAPAGLPDVNTEPVGGSQPAVDLSSANEDVSVSTGGAGNSDMVLEYIVQPGDTLSAIAQRHNTTVERLLEINQLTDPNIIEVNQRLTLPPVPNQTTPNQILLSNALLVRNQHGGPFDVEAFIQAQPGYIRSASDEVRTSRANGVPDLERLSASQVVERVSREFGVDTRLLLALLEYRAGWLTNPQPLEELRSFPMISEEDAGAINREGLYRQLSWTANELNRGYYGFKYDNWQIIEFIDGERLRYAQDLNAASVALQYFLHLNQPYLNWQRDIAPEGFMSVYARYFGDPAADLPDPLTGISDVSALTLPFGQGETWYFTGGPHGVWGSGSAWGSIDFAPPDDRSGQTALCYTSEYPVRAVAPGLIVRSDQGTVVIDLDRDGNELTGWTILYLHIASQGRVAAGASVNTGDAIGYASCEGGFSTATHMHIGRRYNGEWLPASCQNCAVPPFVMSGWTVYGIPGQEYQGSLFRSGEQRVAEQGRANPINQISW